MTIFFILWGTLFGVIDTTLAKHLSSEQKVLTPPF